MLRVPGAASGAGPVNDLHAAWLADRSQGRRLELPAEADPWRQRDRVQRAYEARARRGVAAPASGLDEEPQP
jgi:hypothetical protein